MIFRITHLGNVFVTTKEYVYSLIEKDRERGYKVLVLGTKETPRIKGVDFVRNKGVFRRVLGINFLSSTDKTYDAIYDLTERAHGPYYGKARYISVVSNDHLVDLLTNKFLGLTSKAWKNPLYK